MFRTSSCSISDDTLILTQISRYEFHFDTRDFIFNCVASKSETFLSVRVGNMELRESALHDDDDGTSNEMSRRVLHKMQMSYDRDVLIAQALVRSRVSSSSQENRDILEIELCMSVRDTVLRHRVNPCGFLKSLHGQITRLHF